MQQNRDGEQKSYNLFGRFSFLFFISCTLLFAQESFEKFQRSSADSFASYKDANDKAFANYLKEQWKAYKAKKSRSLYDKPKPVTIEEAQAQVIKSVGPKIVLSPKEDKELLAAKKKEIPTVKEEQERAFSFDFFGAKITFDAPAKMQKANFYPPSQNGVANFFDVAASSNYEPFLDDIKEIAKEMDLNDWGIYLLVQALSKAIYENEDNRKLLSWFLLSKLGYAVKVGLFEKHIVLMHYSDKIIYATPHYTFLDKKYYVLEDYARKKHNKRVFSYPQEYPQATKPLDLSLKRLPRFPNNAKSKTLSFSFLKQEYSVPFTYNKNLLDFMATYPQAEYEIFFNTPLEDQTYKKLRSTFKNYIEGKKASEAMNLVLAFVQKAFVYERDDAQFSREKVMFAQETLFYERSDCEDRAVLFSYLIKKFFDISVVGVKYSDHMSTALYIPLEGERIVVGKKKYVIADPTYVNAPIGVGMPKYRTLRPENYIVVQ